MKKRLLSILLVLVLIVSMLSVGTFADNDVSGDAQNPETLDEQSNDTSSGTDGNNTTTGGTTDNNSTTPEPTPTYTWTVENGTLTITSTGDDTVSVPDFTTEIPAPWDEKNDEIKKIYVDDSITELGDNALNKLNGIEEIRLPVGLILDEGEWPAAAEKAYYTATWTSSEVDDSLVYTPAYTPIEYTVTFVANGETISESKYTVEDTTKVTVPECPAKDGYTGSWPAYSLTGGDVTVTAVYDAIPHTVTFVADGKTVATVTYTADDTALTEPTVPAKAGYTGKWESYTLNGSDLTVEAVYAPVTYKVTFVADGKTVATKTYTVENKSVTAPTVPAKTHYTGKWASYTLTTGDVTVKAVYTPVTYKVTFVADNKTVATVNYTVENTKITEPTVPAKSGYTGKWNSYTLKGGNVTVKATYTFNKYTGIVNASALNVRSGPGTSYNKVSTLARGATVTIVAEKTVDSTKWGQLSNGNWISLSYVTKVSTSTGGSSSSGFKIYTAKVSASALNVRSGAGTSYGVVTTLKKGASVTVTAEQVAGGYTWCKISNGWVAKTYLTGITYTGATTGGTSSGSTSSGSTSSGSTSTGFKTYTATVSASALNVRSGASTSTSVVKTLANGTKVTVTAETTAGGYTWCKISNGWVVKTYLTNITYTGSTSSGSSSSGSTSSGSSSSGTSSSTGTKMQVIASTLNVRSGPGTSYSKVGTLANGAVVTVTSTSGNWGKISSGWVSMDYLITYIDYGSIDTSGTYAYTYATYTTTASSSTNRDTNLKVACNAINGTILVPGQSFSFNGVVGQRTAAKGYKPATVIVGGGYSTSYGGGVCQVSSTVFNAALLSNLKITERNQHSLSVGYLPKGRDAMVNWGTSDFRFVNNSKYCIQIKASASGGKVTVTFLTRESGVSPASKVKLNVARSGYTYTLTRSYNGTVNYTTKSTY